MRHPTTADLSIAGVFTRIGPHQNPLEHVCVVHLVDVQAIPPPGGLDPTDKPQRQVGDTPRRLVEMRTTATRLRLRLRLDLLLRPGTDVDVVVIAVIGVLDHPHNVHPLRLEIPASCPSRTVDCRHGDKGDDDEQRWQVDDADRWNAARDERIFDSSKICRRRAMIFFVQ